MISYNINITEGDPINRCEYLAVIGVYDDGINTKGCFVAENSLKKLLEETKQAVLRYDRERHNGKM